MRLTKFVISRDFFEGNAVSVARKLLGKKISFNGCSGVIVETEAYTNDPASHGKKITPRSEIMARTHGHVYVYFIYGMHYCLNFTTNKGSVGAVLIRALEPLEGIELMKKRRNCDVKNLTNGPAKVCQALGIDKKLNGKVLGVRIFLEDSKEVGEEEIVVTTRVGISQGKDLPWRFYIKNNEFVSGK